MPANANLQLSLSALLEGTVDIGVVSHEIAYGPSIQFGDGNGANQINRVWADTRTIAASANEDIDLAGTLVDAIGQTVTLARVRALIIRAAAANTNNLIVGGAASNGFATWVGSATNTVIVRPGGMLVLVAPDATAYAVTAATGDLLRVANSAGGTSVTYDIVVLGSAT